MVTLIAKRFETRGGRRADTRMVTPMSNGLEMCGYTRLGNRVAKRRTSRMSHRMICPVTGRVAQRQPRRYATGGSPWLEKRMLTPQSKRMSPHMTGRLRMRLKGRLVSGAQQRVGMRNNMGGQTHLVARMEAGLEVRCAKCNVTHQGGCRGKRSGLRCASRGVTRAAMWLNVRVAMSSTTRRVMRIGMRSSMRMGIPPAMRRGTRIAIRSASGGGLGLVTSLNRGVGSLIDMRSGKCSGSGHVKRLGRRWAKGVGNGVAQARG